MKRLIKRSLAFVTVLALLIASFSMAALATETSEPTVIKHTFGGANGEWELDTDNSEGIWSYYTSFGTIDTIQPTVLQLTGDQNGRTTGEAYYALNKDGFMHPGASDPWSMPVVALKMEAAGTLKAVMNANKPDGGGNGVVAKFFKNNDAGRLVEQALTTAGAHTMEATIEVEAGDVIYFLIHHAGDIASDGATYVLDYTLTVPAEEQPEEPAGDVIKHTFGGANGEWELDTDNSQGVWSYYTSYGTIDTIQPTVLQLTGDQNGRTTGEAFYALNKDGFMHPGASDPYSMPVVALKMEAAGTLKAVMNANKPDGGGNGVVAKFFKNNDAGLMVEQALTAAGAHSMEATIEVEAGDVIYFLIHHAGDIACDGATYVLDYTLTVPAEEQPEEPTGDVIKHTFGGANGEWELDTDNSQGVWSYYTSYGTIDTIQPTVLQLTGDQNGRTTGEAYYALNKNGFMHPGASDPWSMPVVALKMEAAGTLKAVMNANKPDGGGNGVVAKFFKNNDAGLLVEQALATAGDHTMEATVEVEAGDVIYFLIHHVNDISSDGATYILDYTLTVADESEPENPGTDPENPGTDPENPGTDPENPGTDPENPGTDPENPGTDPENPGTDPENPGEDPENPGTDPENPGEDPEKPEPVKKEIKHTFGGANGEWELDTDNSQGIWSYYTTYGMISSIQDTVLVLNDDQTGRTTGEAYYALNKNGFMHPGASDPWSMPVVALKMEASGTLKAVMNANKPDGAGNGVVVKFLKNDDAGLLIEKNLTAAGDHTMEVEIEVEKGDVIYFLVHHNNDIACDGATYVLDYTLTTFEDPTDTPAPTGDTFTALPLALLVLSGAAVAVIIKKKEN